MAPPVLALLVTPSWTLSTRLTTAAPSGPPPPPPPPQEFSEVRPTVFILRTSSMFESSQTNTRTGLDVLTVGRGQKGYEYISWRISNLPLSVKLAFVKHLHFEKFYFTFS